MTFHFRKILAAVAVVTLAGVTAQADTAPTQPLDPLLLLWPEGVTPPQPPVREIRLTWTTGVFR